MSVIKLGHIGLTVSSLERARDFYRDLFGFEEFFRVRREAPWVGEQVGYPYAVIEFLHMRGHGLHLELLKYISPCASNPLPDDTYRPGSTHINFWVEEIESLTGRINEYIRAMPDPGLARFAPAKLDLDATTITEGPQTGGKGYYMRDPDGHTLEIWQPAMTIDARAFGK